MQQLYANPRLVPVVVAARDLPAGQPLDPSVFSVRMQAEAASGTFNEMNTLAGCTTRVAVAQGTPLTEDAMSSGLADVIASGERAVAVQVDETNAVGNYVRPGNFVDVFFMLKREAGAATDAEIQTTQARLLLLSKVRVLSVGGASVSGVQAGVARDPNAQINRSSASRTAVLRGAHGRCRCPHARGKLGPSHACAAQQRRRRSAAAASLRAARATQGSTRRRRAAMKSK